MSLRHPNPSETRSVCNHGILVPHEYFIEVVAFLVDAEIWKRIQLSVNPGLCDDIGYGGAHQT